MTRGELRGAKDLRRKHGPSQDEVLTPTQLAFRCRVMELAWALYDCTVPAGYVATVPSGHRLQGADALHIAAHCCPRWAASSQSRTEGPLDLPSH